MMWTGRSLFDCGVGYGGLCGDVCRACVTSRGSLDGRLCRDLMCFYAECTCGVLSFHMAPTHDGRHAHILLV